MYYGMIKSMPIILGKVPGAPLKDEIGELTRAPNIMGKGYAVP
jgi:hypothetical protein